MLFRADDVESGRGGPIKDGEMGSLDERVAYLEGRMEDHTALMADIRAEMRGLRENMDHRFDRMDQKIDRHFTWVIGLFVSMFVTLVLGLLGLSLQMSRLPAL